MSKRTFFKTEKQTNYFSDNNGLRQNCFDLSNPSVSFKETFKKKQFFSEHDD